MNTPDLVKQISRDLNNRTHLKLSPDQIAEIGHMLGTYYFDGMEEGLRRGQAVAVRAIENMKSKVTATAVKS